MIHYLDCYRFVWLGGRYGGGKTLAAVALAKRLLDSGRVLRVYSNIPVEFAGAISEATGDVRDSAFIVDEAWLWFDSRTRTFTNTASLLAYLRKKNLYFLLPSVFPLDKRLRLVSLQRIAAFSKLLPGLPWLYQLRVSWDRVVDSSYWLLSPYKYFRMYDHLAVPDYDSTQQFIKSLSVTGFVVSESAFELDFDFPHSVKLKR